MSLASAVRNMLVLAATLVLTAPVANAQTADPLMEKTVSFRVLIGPDGKLVSATPLESTLGPDIQRAALGLAKELRIDPAQSNGKAVSAETTLTLVVQFIQQADSSYRLGLKSARLIPEAVNRVPPVYPRKMGDKHGAAAALALELVVLPDGSVDASKTRVVQAAVSGGSDADQAKLTQAATDAIAQWRFKPDLVAGQPVSTQTSALLRFCSIGPGGCDKPAEPTKSPELLALPRSMSAGQVLPVLHLTTTPVADAPAAEITHVQLRVGIDAQGAVTSARALGKDVPARFAEAARQKLQAARFFPAQSAGRAVSSEMTVSVPVRDESASDGGLHVQLERIGYDFQLVAAPFPWMPQELSRNGIDARTRFRVVLAANGRADMSKSKVELLELSPNAPGMRRKLEANILEAMRYIRVEPVLVDGSPVSISFARGLWFCSNTRRDCAFNSLDEETMKAINEPPVLPAGITLARLVP